MKNNERFNNILNECLERMLKGESIEQCLKSYTEQAGELEPLLRTALATKQACDIEPRPEFKARARLQFRVALNERFRQPEPMRVRRFFVWQSAWATAVTAVVIVLLLAGGTVAAADNSMPDQPLYPVKIATEKVREMATSSPLGKAELHAELADRRVAEIIYLASKDDAEKVEATAQLLNTHLATIASLAEVRKDRMAAPGQVDVAKEDRAATFELTPTPASTPRPTPFPKLAPAPAPRAVPRPVLSPEMMGKAPIARAFEREKLKRVMARYATNHPARINEALKKAPASVRPALRKALEECVAGYERATKKIEAGEAD